MNDRIKGSVFGVVNGSRLNVERVPELGNGSVLLHIVSWDHGPAASIMLTPEQLVVLRSLLWSE